MDNALIQGLRLIAITNRKLAAMPVIDAAAAAVAGGATAVMLREKDMSPRRCYETALALQKICREAGCLLLINGSVEVALAVGADGVHLGFDALPPAVTRQLVGRRLLIGVSAHSDKDLHIAEQNGADYATLSPVFSPNSKQSQTPPLGLDAFARHASRSGLPLIALGGITRENAAACLRANAAGVAVIGAVFGSSDPRKATENLLNSL